MKAHHLTKLLLWMSGLLAVPLVRSAEPAASPEGRIWKHPAEWSTRSIRRWFLELPRELQYSEVRFREGDDPQWAKPTTDDRAWRVMGFWDMPARAGIHWIRFRVRMGESGQLRMPAGVMISTVIAYEVYWDGVLLGNSGVPGMNRESEVSGRVDSWFSMPAGLLEPGEHVVAVRASSYRCGFPAAKSGIRFLVDSPAVLQGKAVREAILPTVAAGAMFMVGMACLIMWLLAARRRSLLLLCGMCACVGAMQALHAARWFFQYPAEWHYPVLFTMTWLVALQVMCMVAFIVVHFSVPRRGWLVGALIPIFALVAWLGPERMNLEGVFISMVGIAVCLACVTWAVWRKRRGAWPAMIGILLGVVLLLMDPQDFRTNFFVKFLPVMLGLIASLAVQLHDERRRAQAAQLAAARLELEMLKKNIQPHFLLNTLATIMETIEQEPKTAAALVEALAGEFRILSRVAGEKLIPLAQELELCRAHLRVMSLRKGVTCSLHADGGDERTLVPPALFHTLVENGLTHLLPRAGRQDFDLRVERDESRIRFVLLARGEHSPAGETSRRSLSLTATKEGTGLRYIKARLEESFTGCWALESEPVSEGWRTVIEIRGESVGSTARHPALMNGAASLPMAEKPA